MDKQLKPCPFCGGEAVCYAIARSCVSVFSRVICIKCPAEVSRSFCVNSIEEGEQKIIELWNRRVDDGREA